MNSEPPPIKQPGPLSLRRYGCLIILVALATLVVIGFMVLSYVASSTAVPFRMAASFVEKVNPNVKISGISGDLSTGPSVRSITWGDDPANRSEILDLRFKFDVDPKSGTGAKKRVVISDVGVGKAHIDLADFGPVTRTKTVTTNSGGRPVSTPGNSTPTFSQFGLESFEIKQVLIEDVLITDRNSPFRLSIPKISWTGFKVTTDKVEAGELVVESDRLALHTGPGRTLPFGSGTVTFQKTLTGSAQPLLHPAILKPVSFTLDYTFVPEVKAPAYHFSTADGKVEAATTAEGGQTLHIRHLDLAEYFDARKLYGPEAAEFPRDLVLDTEVAPEGGPPKIVSGSFQLGVTTFAIVPAELDPADADKDKLIGVVKIGDGEIWWILPLKDWPMECRPIFKSLPELPPKEILARVFAGKKYEELSAEEKAGVDARMPVYFSPAVP